MSARVRVSDSFYDDWQWIGAPGDSVALWVASMAFCARVRSPDGYIEPGDALHLINVRNAKKTLRDLVERSAFIPCGTGYVIRGYNPEFPSLGRPHIPNEVRAAIYGRDGHRCVQCGAVDRLSLDHIHPRSKGGTDDPSNLQTLCRSCNSRKGAKV